MVLLPCKSPRSVVEMSNPLREVGRTSGDGIHAFCHGGPDSDERLRDLESQNLYRVGVGQPTSPAQSLRE